MPLTGFLEHIWNIAGLYHRGHPSTIEYVIRVWRCVVGGDSGLRTGVFVPVGLWLCKKITTLIFIAAEQILKDRKTDWPKCSTVNTVYYTACVYIETSPSLPVFSANSDSIFTQQDLFINFLLLKWKKRGFNR